MYFSLRKMIFTWLLNDQQCLYDYPQNLHNYNLSFSCCTCNQISITAATICCDINRVVLIWHFQFQPIFMFISINFTDSDPPLEIRSPQVLHLANFISSESGV